MKNEVKMSNDSYKDKLEKLINICHKHNINILITKEEINECLVNDKSGKKVVDTKKMFEQNTDENEIVRYTTLTYDELLELEKEGILSGANTKLTLAKLKKYIKEE